jgi:ELWxxDGT repeat protein
MPPDAFQEAVQLIKSGQNQRGQQLLIQYLQTNPQHEAAWMWLVQTLPSDSERVKTLEACLKFNPDSQVARQALEHFRKLAAVSAPAQEPPTAVAPALAQVNPFLPGNENMFDESVPPEPKQSRPAAAEASVPAAQPSAQPIEPAAASATPLQPPLAIPGEKPRRGPRPLLVVLGIIILLGALAAVIWLGLHGSPFAPTQTPQILPTDTPVAGFDATRLALSIRIAAGLAAAPTPLPSITAVPQPAPAHAPPAYAIPPASGGADAQVSGPFDLKGSALLFYAAALQKYDPARRSLVKIKDYTDAAAVNGFTVVGAQLYFYASNQTQGAIWRSDGTPAGTVEVKAGGMVRQQVDEETAALGSLYFFVARDDQQNERLWRSDGTATGTLPLTPPGANREAMPRYLTVVGETLYFAYQDAAHGLELWKTNGSTAGTQLVKSIASNGQAGLHNLVAWKGLLYFAAFDAQGSPGLWKCDGTPDGTVMVTSFAGEVPADAIGQIAAAGDSLFLAIVRGPNLELWKSDGSAAGTTRIRSFPAEFDLSRLPAFTYTNHTLFFIANDGSSGLQLWKSDGTLAGTQIVRTINSSGSALEITYQQAFQPHLLVPVGSKVFFAADDGVHGVELWQSDGSLDGTQLVADLSPGSKNSDPDNLISVGTSLFFSVNDGGLMVYTP